MPPASKEELARVKQVERKEKKVHSEVNASEELARVKQVERKEKKVHSEADASATGAIKKKPKKKKKNSVKQVLGGGVLEEVVGDAVCKVDDVKDIQVKDFPKDMSEGTLWQICLQFGKVNRLKLCGGHAYVRYSTVEEREFAVIKLKELQKCHFAEPSENLTGKTESFYEEGDLTNACLFSNGHYEKRILLKAIWQK